MPRIFVSHCNSDDQSTQLIKRLSSTLSEKDYEVLVDFERLKPGSKWRDEIYTWLGLCNGAVIFISRQALENDSVWVPREASILTWRQSLQPDFPIFPILMPGVNLDDLRSNNQFRDLRLDSFQLISYIDHNTTIDSVLTGLTNHLNEDKTPLEEIAVQVEILLKDAEDEAIEDALRILGTDSGNLHFFSNARQNLALALFQLPLSEAIKSLEFLVPLVPDVTVIDRILDIIAPTWVDLKAARWIAIYGCMNDQKPAVVLNAQSKFAAEMYVRRASCKPPKTCWHIVAVTGIFGESAFDDLSREIWQALLSSFADILINDPFEDDLDEQLVQLLRTLHQRNHPVVIVLKLPIRPILLIQRLQDRYPYLLFLFLSGENLPDPEQYPETILYRIEPALLAGQEHEARNEFLTARSIINQGKYYVQFPVMLSC